jgi:hypothetical protein
MNVRARAGVGNSMKRLAWAAGGKLVSGDDVKQISLQYTFAAPGAHCIQFNMAPPKLAVGVPHTAPVKAEALITWEVNGQTTTRRVSIGDGTTVQGTGESVKVVMYDVTNVGDSPPSPDDLGLEYLVSADVAPGTRGSFTNPPILIENNTVIPVIHGVPKFVNIPPDAGVTSVLVSVADPAGAPVADQIPQVLQHLDSAGGSTLMWYDPRSFLFAPVAPGVRVIELRNNSLAGQALLFGVIFGIDG